MNKLKWINPNTNFTQEIDIEKYDSYIFYGRNGTGKTTTSIENKGKNITVLNSKSIYFDISNSSTDSNTKKEFGSFFVGKDIEKTIDSLESINNINNKILEFSLKDLVSNKNTYDKDALKKTIENISDLELIKTIKDSVKDYEETFLDKKDIILKIKEQFKVGEEKITNSIIEKITKNVFDSLNFSKIITSDYKEITEKYISELGNQKELTLINNWIINYNNYSNEISNLKSSIEIYNKEINDNKNLKKIIREKDPVLIKEISKIYNLYKKNNWDNEICIYCDSNIEKQKLDEIIQISNLKINSITQEINEIIEKISSLSLILFFKNDENAKKIIEKDYSKNLIIISDINNKISSMKNQINQMNVINKNIKIKNLKETIMPEESMVIKIAKNSFNLNYCKRKEMIEIEVIKILKGTFIKEIKDKLTKSSDEAKSLINDDLNVRLKKFGIDKDIFIKTTSPYGDSTEIRAEISDTSKKSINYLSDGEVSSLSFALFISLAKKKISEAIENEIPHIFILDDPINSNDSFVIAEKVNMIIKLAEDFPNKKKGLIKVIIFTHNSDYMVYNQKWLTEEKDKGLYRVYGNEIEEIDLSKMLKSDLEIYRDIVNNLIETPTKRTFKMFISVIWRIHDQIRELRKIMPKKFNSKLFDNKEGKKIKKLIIGGDKHKYDAKLLSSNIDWLNNLIISIAKDVFNIEVKDGWSIDKENLLKIPETEITTDNKNEQIIEWICESAYKGTFYGDFDEERNGIDNYLRHKKYLVAKNLTLIELESN